MATEMEFKALIEKVAIEYNLNDNQASMIEMYCTENGSDCGENAWQVAIDTLKMIIDTVLPPLVHSRQASTYLLVI